MNIEFHPADYYAIGVTLQLQHHIRMHKIAKIFSLIIWFLVRLTIIVFHVRLLQCGMAISCSIKNIIYFAVIRCAGA